MLNDAGEAGDVQRRSSAAPPDDRAAIWKRVRGANYVIARRWWRTMQARLARWETTVDNPSDFSNIFSTALYVRGIMGVCVPY